MTENLTCRVSMLFAVALAVAVAGCSTLDKIGLGKGTSGKSAATSEGVFYTGEAELALYQSPAGRTIVGQLPPHSKVIRDHVQKGLAHVRVDATGQKGWVDNGKLSWRAPEASPAPVPPEAVPAPEAAVPQPVKPQELPEAKALEQPAAAPKTGASAVAPSIFNPY